MSERWTHRARAFLAALALALAALAAPTARAEDSLAKPERIETARDARRLTEDVRVELSVSKYKFDPLEPVELYAEAENVSKHHVPRPSIGYPPHVNYRNFLIKVFDSNGNLMPTTRYFEYDVKYLQRGFPVGRSGLGADFSPGDVIWHELLANLAYDMTSPGTYTILVEFPTGRTQTIDGEDVPIVAQSHPVQIEVIDPPPRVTPRRAWPEPDSK